MVNPSPIQFGIQESIMVSLHSFILMILFPLQSFKCSHIQMLLSWKVDVVFAILNLICECVSAAMEQVAGDSRVYLWVGFACALMAVGFSVGEYLWMKLNKIDIGIMDVIGFVAAGLQIFSCCMQVWFAYAHEEFPIKFSLFSIMVAIISACHRMFWKSGTHQFFMYCEESRYHLPLTVREKDSSKTILKCTSFQVSSKESRRIPSYFICPIFQEIMVDPHVAADGFTYELEALRGWFDGGHSTSPMTNLRLPHCNVIPNRSLRSAIQEWQQLEWQRAASDFVPQVFL